VAVRAPHLYRSLRLFGLADETSFVSHAPTEYSPPLQPDGRASAEKVAAMIETALREGSHFFEWTFRVKQRSATIDVSGPLVFDEMRSVLDAATQGCGLAYVFEQFAAREIRSGVLVPVLEKFSPPSEAFHLYYPARTGMPGKLRAFLDFMREANPT